MEKGVILKVPFEAIFFNDKNIPKEIPMDKRIPLNKKVTIIKVIFLETTNNVGFVVEGYELGEDCAPYHYWTPQRFAIKQEKPKERYKYELN